MKIIIVGCGNVGATLAEQLSREKHDITVIDRKPEAIQQITTACGEHFNQLRCAWNCRKWREL